MNTLKFIAIFVGLLLLAGCEGHIEVPTSYSDNLTWDISHIGPGNATYTKISGMAIADVRGNGIPRFYTAETYYDPYTAKILEYTYQQNSGQWSGETIFLTHSQFFIISAMLAGPGHNDGVDRLYFSNYAEPGSLYELSYAEGKWQTVTIDTSAHLHKVIAIGPGRNDGVTRIYTTLYSGAISEYSYSNETWIRSEISTGNEKKFDALAIGTGRNDGVFRIYAANSNGHIYELTYAGSSWEVAELGTVKDEKWGNEVFITIGQGRSDGIERVYASVEHIGLLYEFTYNPEGFWQKDSVRQGYGCEGLAIGRGRNDEIFRIYQAGNFGHLTEFTFSDSKWHTTADLRGGPSFTNVIIGPGRGDGINRVYGSCNDGYIYEYSYHH